jgi:hypothetical protein
MKKYLLEEFSLTKNYRVQTSNHNVKREKWAELMPKLNDVVNTHNDMVTDLTDDIRGDEPTRLTFYALDEENKRFTGQ